MTALKTELAQTQSQRVPHAPHSSIPKSDVWAAIKYVYDTITASLTAITYAADMAREAVGVLHGRVSNNEGATRRAALEARMAREAALRAASDRRKIDISASDAQIALKAQVFN